MTEPFKERVLAVLVRDEIEELAEFLERKLTEEDINEIADQFESRFNRYIDDGNSWNEILADVIKDVTDR